MDIPIIICASVLHEREMIHDATSLSGNERLLLVERGYSLTFIVQHCCNCLLDVI